MQNKFKVSLLQMNIVPGNAEHNLRIALDLAKKAMQEKPQVLVLPEMWSTDFLSTKDRQLAETTPQVLKELSAFAQKNSVFILGTLPELDNNKLYNTFYTISPKGKAISKYRKTNLFKLTGEHITYSAGKEAASFNTDLGKWATAICFDVRFPEFINKLASGETQVLFISAQWPVERKEHWETILKARAIEHQIFVVGVNRVGKNKGLEYPGTSLVIDPWGDILAEGSSGEEVITCDIDLAKIKEVQKKLPLF